MATELHRTGRIAVGLLLPLVPFAIILNVLCGPGKGQTEPVSTVGLSEFESTTEELRQSGDYVSLEALCADALALPLVPEQVLRVRQVLAETYIQSGQTASAELLTEQMIQEHAGQDSLAEALCGIGDTWNSVGQSERAWQLYERVATELTASPYGLWAQMRLCQISIRSEDSVLAAERVNRLLTQFTQHPRLPLAICVVGDAYKDSGNSELALGLYEYAVQAYPNRPDSIWAQKNICTFLIASQDVPAAQVATDRLMDLFVENVDAARALCEVGDAWRNAGVSAQAIRLYQHIVTHYPGDEYALWAQKNLVTHHVFARDLESANLALLTLMQDYAEHPKLKSALLSVGNTWYDTQDYDKAKAVYSVIRDTFPGTDEGLWAIQNMGKIHAMRGQESEVHACVTQLLTEYDTNRNLGIALFQVGEEYYMLADQQRREGFRDASRSNFARAIALWDTAKKKPGETHQQYAYYYTAGAYLYMQDYEKVIAELAHLVNTWPDYPSAWNAYRTMGMCYMASAQKGVLPLGPARTLAGQAYQKVIDTFPDNPLINDVRYRLGHIRYAEALWTDAAELFELFVEHSGNDIRRPTALYHLGRCYEAMKDPAQARSVYELYLATAPIEDPRYAMVQDRLSAL